MARKDIDPVYFSQNNLPDYDRYLFQLVDEVTKALESGRVAGVSILVWDYTGAFDALGRHGTAEALAYVAAAHELWEGVVETQNKRAAPENIADLARECLTTRQIAFDNLLPEYNHRRDFDGLFERFLTIAQAVDLKPRSR